MGRRGGEVVAARGQGSGVARMSAGRRVVERRIRRLGGDWQGAAARPGWWVE